MKSKQSIRILIGLMSLALLGVIVIQFLWIKNAVLLKQEEFDRSVNMAMIRVSADLENKYGVHLITEKLEKDSAARTMLMTQDPGFYKFMININEDDSRNEEPDWNNTTIEISGDDAMDANINFRGPRRNRQVIAMINVNGSEHQEVVIQKAMNNDVPVAPQQPADPEEPVAYCMPAPPPIPAPPIGDNRLMNIVKSVADEYAISQIDPRQVCDVIDSAKIRTSIAKEFKKAGLPPDFDFATYCTQGDTLMINRAAAENPLLDFDYKSPLLATDFIEASTLLLVDFPGRFRYIFSSLAGMFALSVAFTFVIITAFAYSLHLIFSQKKVSEITNDFINNMTHELKTPLATISMTADTLLLQGVNNQPEMVNEYSGMIKGEVKKLSRHVDRILEAAVTENTATEQRLERIDINQLIACEAKLFEPQVTQHQGTITTNLPTGEIYVLAGRDLLRGVVCNLLDNALKYSKENPAIKVSLQQKGSSVVLCVADSGIGISKADQKHVFEKFYRAHTGNRHDVKGFGLGLSFAKSVVEGAGGKIWVESTPGQGSNFYIQLPTA